MIVHRCVQGFARSCVRTASRSMPPQQHLEVTPLLSFMPTEFGGAEGMRREGEEAELPEVAGAANAVSATFTRHPY